MSGMRGPRGNAEQREAGRSVFVGCSSEATSLGHGGGRAASDGAWQAERGTDGLMRGAMA